MFELGTIQPSISVKEAWHLGTVAQLGKGATGRDAGTIAKATRTALSSESNDWKSFQISIFSEDLHGGESKGMSRAHYPLQRLPCGTEFCLSFCRPGALKQQRAKHDAKKCEHAVWKHESDTGHTTVLWNAISLSRLPALRRARPKLQRVFRVSTCSQPRTL